MFESVLTTRGVTETTALAARIAADVVPGDVLLLTGELASGKTQFVQGLAVALGYTGPVTSPTFTLANVYETPRGPLVHMDTYRLDDLRQFRDLGFDAYFDTSVTCIEWGGLVADDFPDALHLDLSVVPGADDERRVALSASAERWRGVVENLATTGRA
ncbi:tRNA (adenosine(37)-N6)-threonylcarbamoyltransferase complex ATPase subunit type 1 TsaE [Spongisporangium articulatum]|uniref:tRNA threonylcarbamoyladenosine biosynthesis protein TsaE n=1 Tax=Spongisporangium articulatum TaxID=3362603 RepID=A0ABW8ATG0_9ACTN